MLVFFFQLLKGELYFVVAFTHNFKEPSSREYYTAIARKSCPPSSQSECECYYLQPYSKNYLSLNLSAISFVLYPSAEAKLSLILKVYSNEI